MATRRTGDGPIGPRAGQQASGRAAQGSVSPRSTQPAAPATNPARLDDRKVEVLRAIVEDYVATQEPVGSKALTDRHRLGVSPATVRNDMAALEELGYIVQPHTSAGRVPTDLGYRLFVDRIARVKPLSSAEHRAIEQFLGAAVDVDDVVNRSVRLLAQLTRQIAIVQYPNRTRSVVQHVELVALADTRVLLVVIAQNGRVEQRTLEVGHPVDHAMLGDLRARINLAVGGRRFIDAAHGLEGLSERFPDAETRALAATIVAALLALMVEDTDERVAVAGVANVSAFGRDYEHAIRPVLEALEENLVLMRLFGEASAQAVEPGGRGTGPARAAGIRVSIGHENPVSSLTGASLVASTYGSAAPGTRDATVAEPLGSLGVVGPTRMNYAANIAAVRAVARYVSRILTGE